ncbi:YjbF family lipoprotein [Polynucleobacter sphagniphilus]|uniref:YjbF family lipoprotein n=1 Tax=Polynucleobacter sphagniphilus TaxID=1743169 RepID=UPI0024750C82|nr:YjbF family lipoprotein [Polynucleobacter sphagniphilus]MDH6525135.1 hypothetical protein [Polynucleobacter sphagniphilus]
MLRLWRIFLTLPLLLILCACIGGKQTLIWDTFKTGILGTNGLIDEAVLNPNYRYLRAEMNGQSALLVLGYETLKGDFLTETWYSNNKEVIQFENGRLIGTSGLDVNWTDVSLVDAPAITSPDLFPDPSNSSVKSKRNPKLFFFRTRSVMPQFLANIHEAVSMQGLNEIPEDAPKILQDPNFRLNLKWVQETVVLQPNNPSVYALRAIYAYDKKTHAIIFGRQCLTQTSCLSWLRWPYLDITSSPPKESVSAQ